MEKKLNSFEGKLTLLQSGKWKQEVELWLLNSKVNRNQWQYLNLAEHLPLFANTPILCAYVGNQIGDGHNMEMTVDKDGNEIPDFRGKTAERIVGVIPTGSDLELRNKDGIEWIVARGTLFTWYNMQLVEKLKSQGSLSVSIETLIDEWHKDGDVEVFTKWQVLGTTILNEAVPPAVVDANIRALAALSLNELKEITMLKVASANAAIKNPQNNKRKGEKAKMIRLKELQAKLPEYSILAVNDGTVAMMNEDNELYVCSAEKENGEVVLGAKVALDTVHFVDGETDIQVKANDLLGKIVAKCSKAIKDYEAEHEARVNAEETVEKMKKAENNRRKEAIAQAIKNRLAEINSNRTNKIDESVCDELLCDDKLAEYAEMEDKDGNCTGIEAASKAVDSLCMQKIIEFDKKVASSVNNGYVFMNGAITPSGEPDGIMAHINKIHEDNN